MSSGPPLPPGTGAAAVPASAPDLISDAVAVIEGELLDESVSASHVLPESLVELEAVLFPALADVEFPDDEPPDELGALELEA